MSELRRGYKQTEVGVIPEDWKLQSLEQIADPKRPIGYGIVQTGRPVNNGVRCLRVVDILGGTVDTANLITTSPEISNAYRRTILAKGDLVIALRGKIGSLAVIEDELVGANLTRGVALLAPRKEHDSYYLCHALSSPRGKQIFEKNLNGSALQEIPIATLRKIPAPIPPLPEQRAIAGVLGDVDALIGALDRLIAKKRDLKQAAMQQLLTGQTRLPGFKDQWKEWSISQVAPRIIDYRGRTPLKLGMDWGNGDIPALSARNVKMGYIDFDEETYYGSEALYKRWMTNGDSQRGDVVVTTEAPLGNVALIPDDRRYILSQRAILLKVDAQIAVNQFLLQAMISRAFQNTLLENSSGSTATGIQRKRFERLSLRLPPVPEQTAIASVLSDMDSELSALEERLHKTRLLKQGMMQELLTGRIRLS